MEGINCKEKKTVRNKKGNNSPYKLTFKIFFFLKLIFSFSCASREIYFEPGNVYTYMIGTKDLGSLHYAVLEWSYVTAYYNPLTWRILSQPLVYVNRIHIDSVEMQER